MKPSFPFPASLFLGLAIFLGCAPPQALPPAAPKQVYVNLDSLLPLHPAYSLLRQPPSAAGALAQLKREPPQEPIPTSTQQALSDILSSPLDAHTFTPLFPASSVLASLSGDRSDALIGLKTVVQSRRQAATDLLEEQFDTQIRQPSLPLRRLAEQAAQAQLEQIVALQARLAAPDLSPELRTTTQKTLASLRGERQAFLQAERRKAALELQRLWTDQRLATERELAKYDSRLRAEAENAFASRTQQASADFQTFEQLLLSMAAPRPPVAAQQIIVLTTSPHPGASFPTPPIEAQKDSLSRIRKEVAAAVAHVAAQNSWNVSFVPRADTEDVTDNVRIVLSKQFYPKS